MRLTPTLILIYGKESSHAGNGTGLTPLPGLQVQLSRTTCLRLFVYFINISAASASLTNVLSQIYGGNSALFNPLAGGGGQRGGARREPSFLDWIRTTQSSKPPLVAVRLYAGLANRPSVTQLSADGAPPHLFLTLQPAVHHGVIGAERGAGRLPLKLSVAVPGPSITGQAAVRVHAFTLRRQQNPGLG